MTTIEKKQRLMDVRIRREKWLADGKRPYREQYIWDYYHNGLSPTDSDPTLFNFSIQTSDSPEGDTWWSGQCRFLNSNTDVEILKETYTRH